MAATGKGIAFIIGQLIVKQIISAHLFIKLGQQQQTKLNVLYQNSDRVIWLADTSPIKSPVTSDNAVRTQDYITVGLKQKSKRYTSKMAFAFGAKVIQPLQSILFL